MFEFLKNKNNDEMVELKERIEERIEELEDKNYILDDKVNKINNNRDYNEWIKELESKINSLEEEINGKERVIYNIHKESKNNYTNLNERLTTVEGHLIETDEKIIGIIKSFKKIDDKLNILIDLEKNSKDKEQRKTDVEEESVKVKSFNDYTIEELIPISARVKYKSDFDVLPNGFLKAIGKGAGRFSLNIFDVMEIKEVFGNVRLTPELVDDYSKKYFKLNYMNVKKILYNFLIGKFDRVLDKWEKMNDISNMNIDYDKSIENDDVYINNNGTNVSVYIANSWKANYNNSNNPRNYLINLQKRNRNMSFCVLKCICEKWVIHEEKKDVKVVNNVERRKEMGMS